MDLSNLPPLQGQVAFQDARDSVEFGAFEMPAYGLLSERDFYQDCQEKVFEEHDGEEAVQCLRRCFQVLNPGNHIAKKCPSQGSISFVHCRHTAQIGKRYVQLRKVMEERARVDLLRDCVYRIKCAAAFVRDLKQVVLQEHQMLYTLTHDCVEEIPVSKLFCLNALCEDLRTQIGHWNCIKQKLHTNRWLQPILGSLFCQLDWVKVTLTSLRDKAIWWLEKLVLIGLQVFAHGNVDGLSHEMIWNITRGLEDMNNVVNSLHNGNNPNLSTSRLLRNALSMFSQLPVLNPQTSNSLANIGEHVRAIPFSRVLNLLAAERSKYAALETHRFFTTNEEFLKLLYCGSLPEYIWSEDTNNISDKHDRDTSDYHTATGSMTSLSAAVLKVGSIRAPDLSNSDSPFVELARREQLFAESFLLIVCNSTNLLRKNDGQRTKKSVKLGGSMSSGKPPRGDTPVLSRNDSLRKSVSWGDSADSSIRSQLISRYMDLYWSNFGSNLFIMFYEPCWVRQKSLYFSEIGSLLIQNTTVTALIKHMMQHVCLKASQLLMTQKDTTDPLLNQSNSSEQPDTQSSQPDVFPSGSVSPMLGAIRKCLAVAANGSWDTLMCEALASTRTDKCYPCPLVNGDYSTRTGMLLRDTYQPMMSLVRDSMTELMDLANNVPSLSVNLHLMASVTCRLVSITGVSTTWCRSKTHQFLASMAIGNFLLVSQTDLKMLVDETRSALYQVQMFTKTASQKVVPEDLAYRSLSAVSNQLNIGLDDLQSLPAVCMKQFSQNCTSNAYDYLKTNMPTGKVWRKKAETELPKDHNLYIEHVLETVLEPVLEGVGKLKPTVQLSVVSLATEALCQAWISFILTEKIKFSYVGACQLGYDVKYLKSWLHQTITHDTVRQSILDLSVLKTLGGAVLLLMKQPNKRTAGKFKDSTRDSSADNLSDAALQGEITVAEAEDYIAHVSNPNDWLALRLQGTGRSWRGISSCLNPDA